MSAIAVSKPTRKLNGGVAQCPPDSFHSLRLLSDHGVRLRRRIVAIQLYLVRAQ